MAVTAYGRQFARSGRALPRGAVALLPGGNVALRKRDVCALGGFDERYCYHFDDADLCWRLAGLGRRLVFTEAAAIHHEPAPGPHRRTLWDRDWFTIAQNSIYFALRHAPAATARRLLVPALLQLPKAARLLAWAARGRLPWSALPRSLWAQARGVAAGYRKGLRAQPCLPLSIADAGGAEGSAKQASGARRERTDAGPGSATPVGISGHDHR
jgi:GT2 family glycosyltransferase